MRVRALAIAAMLLIAACGSGDDESATTTVGSDSTVETEIDLGSDSGLEVLAVYQILEGDTLRADADPAHLAVFEHFTSVIPAELRPDVTHFVAISQEGSGGTDGVMQEPVGPDGRPAEGQFYVALDVTGSSAGATLERTMIHEFGHLFSLRPGQVTLPTVEEEESGEIACDYFPDPECPVADSYLAVYYDTFGAEEDAEYDPYTFTTEYAATRPTEDFAESWAEWVRNADDGTYEVDDDGVVRELENGSIAEAKLLFFADFPELVRTKELIRTGLSS